MSADLVFWTVELWEPPGWAYYISDWNDLREAQAHRDQAERQGWHWRLSKTTVEVIGCG